MKNIQLLTLVAALLCTSAFELKAMESESQDSTQINADQDSLDSVEIRDEEGSPKNACVMPASLGKRRDPEKKGKDSAQKKFFLDPEMLAQKMKEAEQQLEESNKKLEDAQNYIKGAGLPPIEVNIRNTAPALSKNARKNLKNVGIELPQSKSADYCSLI